MSSFTGTWDVVHSPDFGDDYLHMEGSPYVRLNEEGKHVTGEYHLGLQCGDIYGHLESEARMIFSFEGIDEMEEVSGAGRAAVEGDRMTFELLYHEGDDCAFECRRHT